MRLEKKKDFEGVDFKWTEDSFKEMKLKFIRLFSKKPDKKVVLTSCLGYCPEGRVSFEETKKGALQGSDSYDPNLSEDEVFNLVFK